MKFDQLKYFLITAELQHVGNAALAVHISPSVISSNIKSLEEEFGVTLFTKQGRNIRLTAEGEKLKNHARKILNSVREIKKDMGVNKGQITGLFRIAADHFLSSIYLAPILAKIKKQHPGIEFEIYSMSGNDIVSEVTNGKIDIGLSLSPMKTKNILDTVVEAGKFVFAVRKNHPVLKKKTSERIKFLNNYPSLIYKLKTGGDTCESNPIFKKLCLDLKDITYFDDNLFAVNYLKNSDAWSFQPDLITASFSDDLVSIKLPEGITSNYDISVISHKSHSACIQLRELIIESLNHSNPQKK